MECFVHKVITDQCLTCDIKTLIPEANVRRRMSALLKSSVSTALECAGGIDGVASLDGIITATGWGFLADSEKFLDNIVTHSEELLTPTPFIQSTFNTAGGQVALLAHNHCYNVTYVNRSHSFEDALLDAWLRVLDGLGSRILVGAFDESTPTQHRIMQRMGAFRRVEDGSGSVFAVLSDDVAGALAKVRRIDFPAESMDAGECLAKYGLSGDTRLLYNSFADAGMYPTASAQSFSEGVRLIGEEAREVVIYNEYFGAKPAVIVLECIG